MKPVGEPDAGDRHVRFDERGWETERWPKAPSYRAHPRLYHLYGPAARCKPKVMIWRRLVLRFCIRPIDGAFEAPGHHGYPRAFDLIRVSAPKARWAT